MYIYIYIGHIISMQVIQTEANHDELAEKTDKQKLHYIITIFTF